MVVISDISEILSKRAKEVLESRSHTTYGWSKHGSCCGKQALNVLYPREYAGYGVNAPGTAFHLWMQREVIPSGTIIKNEEDKDEWEIIGHEQYVFYNDGHVLRKSAIDTIALDLITHEFEIWDLKSTGSQVQYAQLPLEYRAQINFNTRQFMLAWELPYYPIMRIIFGEKVNWLVLNDKKPCRYDPELGNWSEENMEMVYTILNDFNGCAVRWREIIQYALNDWSTTKKKYRHDCMHCDHQKRCLSLLGYDYTKENIEKLLYGGLP